MNKEQLADVIFKRIYVDGPFTFDQLEERALGKGIDIDLFYEAMEIVQRHRKLQVSGKTYKKRVTREHKAIARTWDYPPMIPGVNDASHPVFDGIDYSWMFLTPSEMKEYKLSLKGGRQNPKANPRFST